MFAFNQTTTPTNFGERIPTDTMLYQYVDEGVGNGIEVGEGGGAETGPTGVDEALDWKEVPDCLMVILCCKFRRHQLYRELHSPATIKIACDLSSFR